MRRIVKGSEPEDLRHWKEENVETPQNLIYSNMPKVEVKLQMLVEQGYLCAYTMQRIPTIDDCHIEHIVPRNQNPLLQIDYVNLLACVPSDTPGHRPLGGKYPFGAQKKDRTNIDDSSFVSPTQEDVEQRFQYDPYGNVAALNGDGAAKNTIAVLGLDHDQLVELRKAAIDERVLDIDLSPEGAVNLSSTIMSADAAGRIPEFCSAISQVALWYANKLRNLG
jgi:uncharacterized protein (TIGR02646 family)